MTTKKTAAAIFKEARLEKGWTQAEVAEKAGINANSYAKIERGISQPLLESTKKICKALDVDASKILTLLGY